MRLFIGVYLCAEQVLCVNSHQRQHINISISESKQKNYLQVVNTGQIL